MTTGNSQYGLLEYKEKELVVMLATLQVHLEENQRESKQVTWSRVYFVDETMYQTFRGTKVQTLQEKSLVCCGRPQEKSGTGKSLDSSMNLTKTRVEPGTLNFNMKRFSNKQISQSKSVSELVSLGQYSASNGDWFAAENYLFEAHCKDKDSTTVHELLADVRHRQYLHKSSQGQYFPGTPSCLGDLSKKSGMKLHITNLVFQGGGIKGIAYVGAMDEFQHCVDINAVVRVAGSSAGAIAALLCGLGFTVAEIAERLSEVDWTLLMDGEFAKTFLEAQQHRENISSSLTQKWKAINKKGKVGWLNVVASMLLGRKSAQYKELRKGLSILGKQFGLFPGDIFREAMVEKVIQERTGIAYLTFIELHELKDKHPDKHFRDIYFIGTDISTQEIKIFSWETTPHAIVSDALRCSISMPFVFTPHQQYSKQNGQRVPDPSGHLYVDGGVVENYPIWVFDKAKYLPEIPPDLSPDSHLDNPYTLGFKLVNSETVALYHVCRPYIGNTDQILDLASYLSKLFLVVAHREGSEHLIKPYDQQRTVYIYDLGIQATEFNLDESKLRMLAENGRKAFQLFVTKRVLEHGTERIRELAVLPQKLPNYVYMMFATHDIEQAAEILAERGTRVDEKDAEGNTALHMCALLGDKVTWQKLLKTGLDPNIRNGAGKTASDIAAMFHNRNVFC